MNTKKPIVEAQLIGDTKWIEMRENEIARFITSIENMDRLEALGEILFRKGYIDAEYHGRFTELVDEARDVLIIGKHNTARLRNRKA